MHDLELIKNIYAGFTQKLQLARNLAQRPLTLTEKILYGHGVQFVPSGKDRSGSNLELYPDRVALQDSHAETILLQYASYFHRPIALPAAIHCDHLIVAHRGAEHDLDSALHTHKEVYDFMESASRKYGFDFWKPDSGIIHQIVLEKYAFPGGILLGSNPYMAHAGGLGMLGIAIGETECIEVLSGSTWEMKLPKIIGVKLTGQLKGWATPKDVIFHLAEKLNPKGAIIEYFGEGISSISTGGRASICNFGAELGALSSLFPYDLRSMEYLKATNRGALAALTQSFIGYLAPDREIEEHPDSYFDQLCTVNLSEIQPLINGPSSPTSISRLDDLAETVHKNSYPEKISAAFLGSCNHSSYEDFARLAHLARQALKHGLKVQCPLYITIGSGQVKSLLESQGLLDSLQKAGATVLANSCGPCAGQWVRQDVHFGEKNSILASYNKNSPGRYDGNPGTHCFLASPELVLALALSGRLTFNPLTDLLFNQEGFPVKLEFPNGLEFPSEWPRFQDFGPPAPEQDIELLLTPGSQRLQLMTPFTAWNGEDFEDLKVLAKVKGACTVEHISPGGKWLRLKGNMDLLSDNFLSGASNAFRAVTGKGKNALNNDVEPFSKVAKSYKAKDIPWILIADENYGEGPQREAAAMEVRYLGGVSVVAKSFAAEHEISLKKQGVLVLTFAVSGDYDRISEDDRITIEGLKRFAPNIPLTLLIQHSNKTQSTLLVHHSYTQPQIEWFKAGGILNRLVCCPQ